MSSVPPTTAHDFEGIFEAEFAYVWTSLRRLGVPTRDVEDVTHDVFLAVHKHLHDYDGARSIRPWLFAFAFRFASDYRRRGRNRFEDLGAHAPEPISRAPSADSALETRETRQLVLAALDRLTDADRRAVFILYELDQIPMQTIAESMQVPVNTAYSRLRIAREEFRSAVRLLERGPSSEWKS